VVVPISETAAPIAAAASAPSPQKEPQKEKVGPQVIKATIAGPLESAVVTAAGRDVGVPLTQVLNRSLVWWLRVPNDLLKGDVLTALYEERVGQEPIVHAIRYTSRKHGKTFEAYRYQPRAHAHARFFHPDGTELEEQLVGGPIDEYEQITSLLRDGRRHKGVDFKAPAGTDVKATFDGVIVRKNWNFRVNGNSLEIEESQGPRRSALYLHLSELPKTMKVGDRVKKGQVIAKSGNTGRSFAPHLHYQLMKGSVVLDPFESHQTMRDQLPMADRPAFENEVARLKSSLPADTVAESN
jgi:murein DD-endopeptidase MepM/ murein hydrolase activator NlpD